MQAVDTLIRETASAKVSLAERVSPEPEESAISF